LLRHVRKWVAVAVVGLTLWMGLPHEALATGAAREATPAVPGAPQELVTKRNANAKHFVDRDGRKQVQIHGAPVHFLDQQGAWQEIDSRFVPTKRPGYAFQNAKNRFGLFFGQEASDHFARVELDSHWLAWSILGAKATMAEAQGSQIVYPQVFPGVDLRFQATATGVKEELVVTDDDTPAVYRLNMQADLTVTPTAAGGLALTDSAGAVLMTVPAPFAVDAAGSTGAVELVHRGGSRYDLRVDEEWLRSPGRVYPILIDPSVVVHPDGLSGMDTFISSRAPALNYGGDALLRVGNNGSNIYRSLLKFNLSSVPAGAVITGAQLTLNRVGAAATTAQPYELHAVTREWLEGESTWQNAKGNQTWAAAGGDLDPAVIDGLKTIAPTGASAVTWNVTASVAQALAAGGQNLGLLLKSQVEDTAAVRELQFASSDSLDASKGPTLTITYEEDITPPTVTIPALGTLTGNQVTISATATDTGSGVDRVEFLVDGGVVGTATSAPYSITIDSAKYPDGAHVVSARAYDRAGNMGEPGRLQLLSDSFLNQDQIAAADPEIVIENGAVSLVQTGQAAAAGQPSASSTKAAGSYGVANLTDSNNATYWKSAGQTSASGMETLVLDLGQVRTVNGVSITPLQGTDQLKARIEVLDASDNPVYTRDWITLTSATSPEFGNVSGRKVRLTFTNLTHDLLTGLYHANVAEARAQYHWQSSTPYYDYYQNTGTTDVPFECEVNYSLTDKSCTATKKVYFPYDLMGPGTYIGRSCSSNCNPQNPPSPYTYTETLSGAGTPSAQQAAKSVSFTRYPGGVMDLTYTWYWPNYVTSTSNRYFDAAVYANDPNPWVVEDTAQRYTYFYAYWPLDGVSHAFHRTEHWTKWTHTASITKTFVKTTTYGPYYDSGTTNLVWTSATPSYTDAFGVPNLTDGNAATHWVSAGTTNRTDTVWVEVPLAAPTLLNAVYIDPAFEGLDATLKLSAGAATVLSVPLRNLRTGTVTFSTVTADKLRLELTNLQGLSTPFYAGIAELRASDATVATEGQIKAPARPLPPGTADVVLEASDSQPAGSAITYQLQFDSADPITVTPGTRVAAPAGAQSVQVIAVLEGDGVVSPTIYEWSLATAGSGQLVTFDNGGAAATAPVEVPVINITSPTMLQTVSGNVNIQISTTAPDLTKVEYYVDGVKLQTVTAQPWTWTWNSSQATTGAHVIMALAYNASGKVGGATTAVRVASGLPPTSGTPAGPSRLGLEGFYPYLGVNLLGSHSYVNLTNGNLVSQVSDMLLPGPGLVMDVRRTYNSFPDVGGGPASGWRWNHEISASVDPVTEAVTITNSDGAVYTFPFVNGAYLRPAGVYMWVSRTDGQVTVTRKEGITWYFDMAGRLSAATDRNGNRISYQYDDNGRLFRATNAVGKSIHYEYDSSGRLGKVVYGPDDDRREVNYSYSTDGLLTGVRDLAGSTWTYVYDANRRLLGLVTPSGNLWSVTYNAAGQVSTTVDPLSNTTALAYLSGQTNVTGPRGSLIEFGYNASGQLTRRSEKVTNFEATGFDVILSTYQYDADYNLTSYTDPRNQVFSATYDARGNVTSVTQPPADSRSAATTTTYVYGDSRHPDLPTEVRSPLSLINQYRYDGHGNLIWSAQGTLNQPPSSTAEFSYFANGLRSSERDRYGGITHYEYDPAGNLIKYTNALGYAARADYDWFGNQTSATDEAGNTTATEYDAAGRLIRTAYADGTSRRTVLTIDGTVAREIDNNGNVTSFGYDKAARVTTVTAQTGGVTRYRYDAAGNVVSLTNPNGWTTGHSYDEANRLKQTSVTVTQPTPTTYTSRRKYDSAGNVIKVVNANGHEVSAEFDNLGRQVAQITDPAGVAARTTTSYDARGRVVAAVDPLWHLLSYTYDDLDRLTAVYENLLSGDQYAARTNTTPYTAVSASLAVDAAKTFAGKNSVKVSTSGSKVGEGVQVKVPVRISKGETVTGTVALSGSGRVLVRLTDRKNGSASVSSQVITLGAAWVQTVPLAFTVTGSSDSDNFTLEVLTAESAQATTFHVDALQVNRRTTTTYSPAPNGPLPVTATRTVTSTNALGQATVTTFDLLGQQVAVTDPLGNTQRTAYFPDQARMERTDAIGRTTTYQYDNRGRLAWLRYPTGTGVSYSYDGNGNQLTMTDSLGITTVSYDPLNRPTRVVDPFGRTTAYTYSGAALTQVQGPAGSVTYQYNEAAVPVSMTVLDPQNRTETTSFKFSGTGQLIQQDQGNQRVTWTYDAAERLTRIVGTNNGSSMYTMDYAYDKAGNRTSYTLGRGGNQVYNYTYDSLNRLIRTTESNGTVARTYEYDAVGNRLRRTVTANGTVATDETYAYDQASRLLTLNATSSGKTETTTFDYDANGNQIRATGPKGSTTFSYDFENRLVEQRFSDGSSVAFGYDGAGQRLYTRDADQESYHLYDRGAIVGDLDGSGALIAGYYRDPLGRLVSTHQRTGTYLYQADGLGSIIGLTKTDGTWDSQYTYDEFGVVTTSKGQAWNNFEYTGAPYHEASGLYHLGARYYNPGLGRFISRDTYSGEKWQPWTQNLYVYTGNNPVNLIDPTGHCSEGYHSVWVVLPLPEAGFQGVSTCEPDQITVTMNFSADDLGKLAGVAKDLYEAEANKGFLATIGGFFSGLVGFLPMGKAATIAWGVGGLVVSAFDEWYGANEDEYRQINQVLSEANNMCIGVNGKADPGETYCASVKITGRSYTDSTEMTNVKATLMDQYGNELKDNNGNVMRVVLGSGNTFYAGAMYNVQKKAGML
jgi:RHS repeat-associated protein